MRTIALAALLLPSLAGAQVGGGAASIPGVDNIPQHFIDAAKSAPACDFDGPPQEFCIAAHAVDYVSQVPETCRKNNMPIVVLGDRDVLNGCRKSFLLLRGGIACVIVYVKGQNSTLNHELAHCTGWRHYP